jgi:hypothetical protein
MEERDLLSRMQFRSHQEHNTVAATGKVTLQSGKKTAKKFQKMTSLPTRTLPETVDTVLHVPLSRDKVPAHLLPSTLATQSQPDAREDEEVTVDAKEKPIAFDPNREAYDLDAALQMSEEELLLKMNPRRKQQQQVLGVVMEETDEKEVAAVARGTLKLAIPPSSSPAAAITAIDATVPALAAAPALAVGGRGDTGDRVSMRDQLNAMQQKVQTLLAAQVVAKAKIAATTTTTAANGSGSNNCNANNLDNEDSVESEEANVARLHARLAARRNRRGADITNNDDDRDNSKMED